MPTVLVTGANRGLGFEFVRQYAADGWDVVAACRQPPKAEALQKLAAKHANIRIEALDVTSGKSIDALAKKLKNTAVDVLINNAGVISGNKEAASSAHKDAGQGFGSIDFEAWARVLEANTIAPIMVLQAFIPHILGGKDHKVVNITSKMGSIGVMGSGYIAYRTSKAALNAAMCNIAPDLEAKKIAWVNLHPGWVKTDMGGRGADITPETSITGMRAVIAGLSMKNTGQFLGYDGKVIPW